MTRTDDLGLDCGATMRLHRSGGLTLCSSGRTNRGCVRPSNEDAILMRPEAGLWAVADGMGGHAAGDLASHMVVDALQKLSLNGSAFERGTQIEASIHAANEQIRQLSVRKKLRMMGSTVAALYVHGRHFACIWAGDSRVYLLRNGDLRQVTRDHSVVQEVIDTGLVDERQARKVYAANMITRAVGVGADIDLEATYGEIDPGDVYLLCSDGVTAVLSDAELERMLSGSGVETAAETIESACMAAGAPDNLAIVVVSANYA